MTALSLLATIPAEAARRYPDKVAVVGAGTRVHAGGVTEAELITWAQEKLGKHKYPRQVRFVDSLPLGPSHKVFERELRKTFATGGQQGG